MPGGANIPFTITKSLHKTRAQEYSLQSLFKAGYRNKEDISNLPPETLVVGSQNVLTNAAELVGIRQGYVLDGPAGNQNNYGIDSSYDFLGRNGNVQNLRKWGGNLEVRYTNPISGAVSWISLLNSLNPTKVCNFTNFWDQNTEQKMFALFVNGDNNIYEWSGGVASFASASNASGIIASIAQPNTSSTTSGGAGYTVGDVLTISGGGANATLQVNSTSFGGIATSALGLMGAGYANGDTFSITSQSGYKAYFVVATNSGGAIATYTQKSAGVGFLAGGVYPITAVTGAGSGGTIIVSTVGSTISGWTLLTNGSGYSAGDNNATTGGTGTGATVDIVSVGQYSITVQGTSNLSRLGFYDNSSNSTKFDLIINGTKIVYTTSNANGGQTFVGLSVDPTGLGISVGDAVIQAIFNNTGASVATNGSGNLSTFIFDIISTLANQIWYGSNSSTNVYVSKTNNYQDVSFSTPARLPSEGALIVLDGTLVGFFTQNDQMYATCGRSQWWVSLLTPQTVTVSTVATPTETLSMQKIKTAFNQAAQSQGLISAYKNSIIFVSNEQIINAFGLVQNIQQEPQMANMSDPIKYDIDAYSFAGGQIVYDNYFIYVTVPAMGVVRMYNVVKQYWEAPQVIPISRFYHVTSIEGSTLYGHSSLTNESYQLFTGYNDNGNPINAVAAFPYICVLGGSPFEKKNFNKFYTEGYISSNTALMLTANYDFGGFSGTYTALISGSQAGATKKTIFNRVTDGSLGQNSLGSQPIGTILNLPAGSNNPKFRIVNTMPRVNFFEYQPVFSSNDVDQQWTLLRFGPGIASADDIGVEITI